MSPRAQILEWAERGHLQNLDAALDLAQITPSPEKWRTFLSRLMLATGTLLFGAGVIFFFAYNWKGLPPIARFAIVEALLLAAFALAWHKGLHSHAGRAALFLAALMTGALFALIGQTYQLGAGPWQLFAIWAALILPWALAAQKPDLWLLILLLANVAIGAYPDSHLGPFCLVNLAAQALWEYLAPSPRLAPRMAGVGTAVAFTSLALAQIFGHVQMLPAAAYLIWFAITLAAFVKFRRDLVLVAAALLSGIVAITCLCARGLFRGSEIIGSSLLIALIVIVLSAAAAKWLQYLQKEGEA